ncbi:hypothetical protein HII31_10403 [Pseudocercospora fuligena]|uniref:Uncharacterized protein n=1 Tax=Pseudocercospora fuligena TaxID=685502 RepID=A0A8H6VHJ5_9PEZI|nr:hypothetical protein HII31_10403 [Pseudocercospora fuligena]
MTVNNTYTPQPAANWASGFTLNTKFDFSRVHAYYAWNKMARSNWTTHYIGNEIPLTKCRIEYFPLVATTVAAVLRVKPRSYPDPAMMVQLCQYEWFVIIHALQEKILELQLQDMTGYAFMNILSEHCFQSLQAAGRGFPSYGPVYGGSESFTTHVQMVIDQIVHEAIELQAQTALRAGR